MNHVQQTNGRSVTPPSGSLILPPMRLRYITRADFRMSEETLLNKILKTAKELELGKNDCVLLVSTSGKIVKFVFGFQDFEFIDGAGRRREGVKQRVLSSRTLRLVDHGTFNPYMLGEYAAELGIPLPQAKRLKEFLRLEDEDQRAGTN